MRFALFSLIVALLAAVAMAVPPEYISVIVSWPNGAPESIVQSAIKTVEKDGGKVTHKYSELVSSRALCLASRKAS